MHGRRSLMLQRNNLSYVLSLFYWKEISQNVKDWIHQCSICQATKPSNTKPYGYLQPFPTPLTVWEELTMDFVTHLPLFAGKSALLVVVDRVSKSAHFIPLKSPFTVQTVAKAFFSEIVRYHGIPKTVVGP